MITLHIKTKAELKMLLQSMTMTFDISNDNCNLTECKNAVGQPDSNTLNNLVDDVVVSTRLLERLQHLDSSNLPQR